LLVKPETRFIQGVHKHLPSSTVLHREKMSNPYRGGTADMYYSANKADLWLEYKFLPSVPQRGIVDAKRIDLSPLQKGWLAGRYKEGRNVGVVVGCPPGGVILRDLEWEDGISPEDFRARIQSRPAIAEWIVHQTLS